MGSREGGVEDSDLATPTNNVKRRFCCGEEQEVTLNRTSHSNRKSIQQEVRYVE